jgi:hypothetical protein
MDEISKRGWIVIQGSAKNGLGVEEAFLSLAKQMVE